MVTLPPSPLDGAGGNRFPRTARIKAQRDFDSVFQARKRMADDFLIVHWSKTGSAAPARLGLSVGKKAGNAVERNRWKRLIREVFRHLRSQLPAGVDLVVRPQAGAKPDFARVTASLRQLIARLVRDGNRSRQP